MLPGQLIGSDVSQSSPLVHAHDLVSAHDQGACAPLMLPALHAYEVEIAAARERLEQRDELRGLVDPDSNPNHWSAFWHAFLIQWASRSVQLHEPTEQFLAEASRRCAELGESKLALTLLHIAVDAIDVYRLLADDTRALAQLWNARRLPHLDMTSLLTQPATPAIRRCHEHHRQLLLGSDPWAELASVFEVQALLASVADRVVAHASALLGDEVRRGLCSLRTLARHGDSSLTHAMAGFLTAHPERLEVMVAAGTATLDHYADFLLECCVAGFNLASWQARQHA